MTREEGDILKEIKRNTTREKEVVQALKKEDGLTWEEDGVVYIEGRMHVPNNKKIKEEILKKNHDLVDVGHPGQHRMLELLKRTYWWPGLKEDIKKYVQECFKCQQNKVQHQRKTGELHPLEIPKGLCVRHGSHRGGSPQNGLGDERTCGTTLASAYVLRRLSATWSQLQVKERESEWE